MHMSTAELDLSQLRSQVSSALNELGARLGNSGALSADPAIERLRARVAALGQIAAGLAIIDQECIPSEGAGFGSTVTVRDLDSGAEDEYVLMVGSLLDIDANQVSLASPIGRALLGCTAGHEITIATPHKPLRLRVLSVTTLMDALEEDVLHAE